MSLTKFAVAAPVKVTMIFVAVLLLGYISMTRLPTNLFPDIRAPKVTTTIRTQGLSPVEVERRINEPLERQLYTIRGVVDVETIARSDSAVIITEFTWDTPLDFAFLDVKKAVADLQRDRQQEIESVSVLRYDPNAAPVMTVGLVGPKGSDLEDLRRLAEQTLKPRFERLEGVANVVVSGGVQREIRIALDQTLLLTYGIDVQTVANALRQSNVNASGGYVSEGTRRFLLKTVGEFQDLEDVRSVVVSRQGETAILLEDVAHVTLEPKEPKGIVLVNGRKGIGLSFYREAESNTVAVADRVKGEIRTLQGWATPEERDAPKQPRRGGMGPGGPGMMAMQQTSTILPPDTSLIVSNDQSEFIRAAIREVRNNAILGGLLAVAVLLLFLRDIRTTLIIAIAIPVSIIATFNLMYFQGLTLNLMTLGGLALGTGMLVDNAIVVLENIFRLRQEGKDAKHSAGEGAKQVSGAIIASTLTTVVVFLPIVYVKGVAGLLFKEQALTVAYSLVASLIVALLLIPMLASRFLSSPPKNLMTSDAGTEDMPQARRNWYTGVLRLALKVRWLVLLLAFGSLGITWVLLQQIPQEFLPRTEQRQIGIRLVMPSGTPIEATEQVVENVLGQVSQYEEAIPNVYARVGESEGDVNANTEDPDGPNTADIYVTLHNWDRPTTVALAAGLGNFRSTELIDALKPGLESIPDLKAEFRLQQGSVLDLIGSSKAPLLIEISGEEIEQLTRLAEDAKQRLEHTDGLLNVRTNILQGSPEVRLRLDKTQLARLGLEVEGVAAALRRRIDGEVAGQIKRESGDVDLHVEVDYGTETLDTLGDIILKTPTGATVPLRTIADFRIERGPREIVRRGQERVAQVMTDLDNIKLSEGIARARAALDDMHRPVGYSLRFTGEEEQRAEAFERLAFALMLSIMLVYMVMASIFESFLQPLLIMFTIPLAGVGVVGGFILTGQTLNVMGLIGVVMLGGIVVNNAIVLLDCVNQVRQHPGIDSRESLVIGCERRLRPVLMTTATTLLGLLPLALGVGQGAELRQAMAIAVLGGLVSSTVLTLIVIPVCQSYLDSALRIVRGWRGRHQLANGASSASVSQPPAEPESGG
ncbi:efflux RND transporter permease subunit [bacterium]|nr:efflux RND transporter permease subunit [bacterium]